MADERHDWFISQVFRHRTALHRYLSNFTSGAQDVDDLVQETLIRVYSLTDYRSVDAPKALLLRIGQNLALERAQRRSARPTGSIAGWKLPAPSRRVLVLRKVFKLSVAQISQLLNVSESAIEKHAAAGLVRCRDSMRESAVLETMGAKRRPGTVRRLRDGADAE